MKPIGQKTDRQQQLAQLREKYSKVTDRLAEPIDKGILETVVFLNALGINTRASCEGHLDHGIAAPWVDISAPTTEEYWRSLEKSRELSNLARKKEAEGASTTEVEALFNESHQLDAQLQRPTLEILNKVLDLLAEFYTDRDVSNDQRIIINKCGSGGRLLSQGEVSLAILPTKQKKANLGRYRQEMQAFTEFLEKKFLED